jgi:hypothetical protein
MHMPEMLSRSQSWTTSRPGSAPVYVSTCPEQSKTQAENILWSMKAFSFPKSRLSPSEDIRRHSASASPRLRLRPSPLGSFSTLSAPLLLESNNNSPSEPLDSPQYEAEGTEMLTRVSSLPQQPRHSLSWPNAVGLALPLTPPEDIDYFNWTPQPKTSTPSRQGSHASDYTSSRSEMRTATPDSRSAGRPSAITLPIGEVSDESNPSTWLSRAVQTIGKISPPVTPNTC